MAWHRQIWSSINVPTTTTSTSHKRSYGSGIDIQSSGQGERKMEEWKPNTPLIQPTPRPSRNLPDFKNSVKLKYVKLGWCYDGESGAPSTVLRRDDDGGFAITLLLLPFAR
ncbi:hypothetical protein LINPERPRIM_LOCUS35680, partial [Linum perenne]